jgi:flagellar L-ring protein FlgH
VNLRAMNLRVTIPLLLCALLAAAPRPAQARKHSLDAAASKPTPPEAALAIYIERVRAEQAAEVRSPGSIWSAQGLLVRLGTDPKAYRLHDVVSIVVSESLAASTDGQVKNSRASSANSSLTALFGALKASNNLQNLLGMTASSGLSAQGQSTTNSSLTTTFGGEVVDVLPNGMLVVQATRQLTFSQQTQLIKLRGLVRPEDVTSQNQVLSTDMTDLELEVTGKGIVNDSNGTGDNSNAVAMAGLANQAIVNGLSPTNFYSNFATTLGSTVSQVQTENTAQTASVTQLQTQNDALSSVNLNDEASSMTVLERSYQAAAQVFTMLDAIMASTLNLGEQTTVS